VSDNSQGLFFKPLKCPSPEKTVAHPGILNLKEDNL